jgi:hypothetical protein
MHRGLCFTKMLHTTNALLMCVTRERRRGDRPPTKINVKGMGNIYIWLMWGDKKFVVS